MYTLLKRTLFDARVQHQFLIVLLALVAGHFVVIHTTDKYWLDLLHYSYYYVAVGSSMAIAFLLINYIRYISIELNKRKGGFIANKHRLLQQLILGIGGATLIELGAATLLYWANDVDMIADDYFGKLFMFILLFIVAVNLSYCFYYYYLEQRNSKSETIIITEVKKEIRYKFVPPLAAVPIDLQQPGMIYLEKKVPLAYNAKGELIEWQANLGESLTMLPKSDYFQINKYCIVHRAIVKELKNADGATVLIIPVVRLPIALITSRRRTTLFKEWLAITTKT